MSEENKALVRRWFAEVWDQGRAEAIDELLAPDATIHGLSDGSGKPMVGPADFKPFHTSFRGAFPDITVEIEDAIAEGDRVAVRCRVRGKHAGDTLGFAATNQPAEFTGIAIARVENGKIQEAWNNFDFLNLYQQLGVR